MNEQSQLASPDEKYPIQEWLQSEAFNRKLVAVLNKPEQATRFVQIALNAFQRQPDLTKCTQKSLLNALLKLSQIDLEPDGYHAHLVPFNVKIKQKNGPDLWQKQVQLILDYKGLVTVIRRNPKIAVVKGKVRYAKDLWLYQEGSDRVFRHVPSDEPPSTENYIKGAYSFVRFADGDWELDYLPAWQIERTRERSKAKDQGPWETDYAEMCIKTAIRHHSKTLPLRPEERIAAAVDDDQFIFNEPLEITKPKFQNENKPSTGSEVAGTTSDRQPDEQSGAGNAGVEAVGVPERGEPQQETRATSKADLPPDSERTKATPAPKPTRADKLLSLINKEDLTSPDVVDFLAQFDLPLGDAKTSGLVHDLPEETVVQALQQWESIRFNLKKK